MNELDAVTLPASRHGATTGTNGGDRWLFVDGASAFGGHEVMLLRWLEELAAQPAVEAFLLAREGTQVQRDGMQHATVLRLPRSPAGRIGRALGAIRDVAAFVRAAWTVRPQLCIVAEGALLSQPLFVLLARLIGLQVFVYVPLVQTSVSMGYAKGRLRDALVRGVFGKLPHGWITITREQAEDFRAWAGVRQPILLLQNTVSRAIEAAGAAHAGAVVSSRDARLRVSVLGRLEAHQKGLDMLLDHAVAHPELGRTLAVTCVGTGPYESAIIARLHNDADLARWFAVEPWSATLDVMRRSDALLMASRYEGVPLVMLEAMALGVPVVAPDLPGTRAFLTSDSLYPMGDMARAFEVVERLRDPAARDRTAESNLATFRARASNDAFVASVRALTQQLRALVREQRSTA